MCYPQIVLTDLCQLPLAQTLANSRIRVPSDAKLARFKKTVPPMIASAEASPEVRHEER
jgi:hypothetical protein